MGGFTFYPSKLGKNYSRTDFLFISSIILLWGLGLFTLLVCTPDRAQYLFGNKYYFFTRQLMWSVISFFTLIIFSIIPIRKIRKALPFIVMGSLFLCLLAIVPGIGSERKGASRWINIGHFATLQPSEFAKFAVVLFLANLFDKYLNSDNSEQKNFLYPLIGLFIFVLVIFLQKDFSTGVFIFGIGCIMFFVSGARMTWFGPLVLLAIPATVLLIAMEPYRIMRMVAFFHPEEFIQTSGFQQWAAKRAISAGGVWGSGLGAGLNTVSSIPEVQADYIFAGWASAMGLVGVTAYFVLLIFFAIRGMHIVLNCTNRFACYAAFGCLAMIVVQSLINVAVSCGSVPTTGIPLPFFSSGGSSLLSTSCMCGFIINVSTMDDKDIDVQDMQYDSYESFNDMGLADE